MPNFPNHESNEPYKAGNLGNSFGAHAKFYAPSHLAYGERQMGAHIKPHSSLVFEFELLEVLTRDD